MFERLLSYSPRQLCFMAVFVLFHLLFWPLTRHTCNSRHCSVLFVLFRLLSLLLFLPVNHWLILAFCLICLLQCNLILKTLEQLPLSFVDMDSNIKDICYNPRLHDLVLDIWPPCCATSFVVVVVVVVGPTRP